MRQISIVIPVRNEASLIAATLKSLKHWRAHGHDIIVVDGNSSDATAALAAPLGDSVISTTAGRARQMNAGAAVATGDLIVFLHADTVLPSNAEAELLRLAQDHPDCWGRFDVCLDARPVIFRVIETLMNWRSRLSGIATGDQAIFVTRSLFERVGGFPSIALMEDIALCTKLRRERRPMCLRTRVKTSARRWQTDGVVATIVRMWWLRAAFFFGISPARLYATYYRSKPTNL